MTCNGQARNAFGAIAQEIVWSALGIQPIRINGNCEICFDGKGLDAYFEIKSVRRGAKVVVYKWRLEKEQKSDQKIFYAILIHDCCGLRSKILEKMIGTGKILVLPLSAIVSACSGLPLNVPKPVENKPRHGYTRKGYKDGYYNIPINSLLKLNISGRMAFISMYGIQSVIDILTLEDDAGCSAQRASA